MKLPAKSIERLSQYRRILLKSQMEGMTNIYSHELAQILNITAVQVRRDIMLMGYSSGQKKGYDIKNMINVIGNLLDPKNFLNVAVVGVGNLGRAITSYFKGKRTKLNIIATFDNDPAKFNTVISGVNCYSIQQLPALVKSLDISIAILTVMPENAAKVTETLVMAGIKGILNFTTVPLSISPNVYLEEYDMVTSIEKLAYYVKNNNLGL